MSDWIEVTVDSDELEKLGEKEGVFVRLLVSPYDVPDAVRGFYDEDRNRFVIEFAYVGKEEWELTRYDEHVLLRVGVNSGRLYGLEIDVDAKDARVVALEIDTREKVRHALDRLTQAPPYKHRKSNYKIAREVVIDANDKLYSSLRPI